MDAPALKQVVRKLKDVALTRLEYDGSNADALYPPTDAALPSICGNLHRVGNLSFDMSHIWYGGESNPKRIHVKYRYPSLRFASDSSYQTAACVLLRFVHNRAVVLPIDNPPVAALLITFCSASAVACLEDAIQDLAPNPEARDGDDFDGDDGRMDIWADDFPRAEDFPPLMSETERAVREPRFGKVPPSITRPVRPPTGRPEATALSPSRARRSMLPIVPRRNFWQTHRRQVERSHPRRSPGSTRRLRRLTSLYRRLTVGAVTPTSPRRLLTSRVRRPHPHSSHR